MYDVLKILLDRLQQQARELAAEEQRRIAAEARAERLSFSSADVVALVERIATPGQKIEAINLYRQMTGYGFKESKDAIERVTNQFADVKAA